MSNVTPIRCGPRRSTERFKSVSPAKVITLVPLQVAHYLRTQRGAAGLPEWYETRRATTMVVFWQ